MKIYSLINKLVKQDKLFKTYNRILSEHSDSRLSSIKNLRFSFIFFVHTHLGKKSLHREKLINSYFLKTY